jgi:hypothetical protein
MKSVFRRRLVPIASTSMLAIVATIIGACAPSAHAPNAPIPEALSAHVVWTKVDAQKGKDVRGADVDVVSVSGGALVRIETDVPIDVAERVRAGAGVAETWRRLSPVDGAITIRATLLAEAILARPGTMQRVHVGSGFEPGYTWYRLESDALQWANGPLGAPFPAIAPDARIDRRELAALDATLSEAIAQSKDHDAALDAAHALRSVVALRVVRGLRAPVGFPYFYDHRVTVDDDAQRVEDDDGLATYRVDTARSLTLTVEGPMVLHLWAKATRPETSETLEVRVLEGDRVRARTASGMPAAAKKERSDENEGVPDDAPSLRRAIVHVPPGKHVYRVVGNDLAFVTPLVADPVIHVGDAILGDKDEQGLLDDAMEDGDKAGAPAMRAIALALLGRDGGSEWKDALAASTPSARSIAEVFAAGGPHDPIVALEASASNGDASALGALGDAALHDVDDVVRSAWVRGTLRGTKWVVAHPMTATPNATSTAKSSTWTSVLFTSVDGKACSEAEALGWNEVGVDETIFAATTWRGAKTVELLATTSCDASGPLSFSVDGTKLEANPSSAFARWHVLVENASVKLRRLDAGAGHLYAVSDAAAGCGAHFGAIGAPAVASTTPKLEYGKPGGPAVSAPGLEVWLRDGSKGGEIVVTRGAESVRVVVEAQAGFTALDPEGVRWIRAARIALSTWAALGDATVSGPDDVAVRAIVRAPRGVEGKGGGPIADPTEPTAAKKEAVPLDESKLASISAALLVSQGEARAKLHLARAMLLAEGGAGRAALEDARAAKALGATGPNGEDAIDYVRAQIRALPRKPLALPAGVKAYGVEPDFDPGAKRCGVPKDGPRARLAAIVEALDEAKTKSSTSTTSVAAHPIFDAKLALDAFEAMSLAPVDPRGPTLFQRTLAGSRWTTPRDLGDGGSAALKVQRPTDKQLDGALDADGDLRARVLTGQPFPRGSYATVYEGRPAKAALSGTDGAKAWVEVVCAPRSPADAIDAANATETHCPFVVTVGTNAPLTPQFGPDGRGRVDLPTLPPKGKSSQIVLAMEPSPGRWEAVARVVFDREVPGATHVDDVGWVLLPPGLQYRWLVKGGDQIAPHVDAPTLVRIDALAEPDDHPKIVVAIDGKETTLDADGAPHIFAVSKPGAVTVKSIGGASTILFAERVAKAQLPDPVAVDDAEPDVAHSEIADPAEPVAASTTALLDANGAGNHDGSWRDVAAESPRPLSSFEENFGTVTAHVLGRYGTYREGTQATDTDGYLEQSIGYRRKIESIGLWTGFGGTIREREDSPSWAGSALLYEEIDRFRIAGWLEYWGQDVPGFAPVRTWKPRGFVEYSWRVTPSFFLLPRAGFDGYYTNVASAPVTLFDVDDDVYNDFRFRHPTELFGQLLSWWVPYVNDIFYLRGRATFDASLGVLDHYALRPGAFFAIGDVELGAYGDVAYYRATPGVRTTAIGNVTGSAYALYNLWTNAGALDVQAGVGGRTRSYDGGWEVFAMVNVFASFHRGLRDFTSLELNFPEPLGGGVAWRGPMAGGGK